MRGRFSRLRSVSAPPQYAFLLIITVPAPLVRDIPSLYTISTLKNCALKVGGYAGFADSEDSGA